MKKFCTLALIFCQFGLGACFDDQTGDKHTTSLTPASSRLSASRRISASPEVLLDKEVSAKPAEAEHVEGELLIKLKPASLLPTARAMQLQLTDRGPLISKLAHPEKDESLGLSRWRVFRTTKDARSAAAEVLSSMSDVVEAAEPNYIMRASIVPNDRYADPAGDGYEDFWSPHPAPTGAWGQSYSDLWGLQTIGASQAWLASTCDPNIVVAVVDTGLDYNHEDILGNVWSNPGEIAGNGIDDDHDGYVDDIRGWDFFYGTNDTMDRNGHGTHVAGTIAARGDNSIGITGVCWRAKILPVKALNDAGDGTTISLASSVTYAADRRARVINASWGGPGFPQAIRDAFVYAHLQGAVSVVSAGNDFGADARTHSPANLNEVITVASSDHLDQRSDFSNQGPKIDVAAPGGDSEPITFPPTFDPNYTYENILSLRAAGTDMAGDGIDIVGSRYYRTRGTSMASPAVAGMAALLLSLNPSLTNEEVRQIIRSSALDVGTPGFDAQSGYGRVRLDRAVTQGPVASAYLETYTTYGTDPYYASGTINIRGTAAGAGFHDYVLQISPELEPYVWTTVVAGTSAVNYGVLAQLNTSLYSSGKYVLRLTVKDGAQNSYYSYLYGLRIQNRDIVSNWPRRISDGSMPTMSSPVLGDLDGDGRQEIVVGVETGAGGTDTNSIRIWRADGTSFRAGQTINGYFLDTKFTNAARGCTTGMLTPSLADLDGDGRPEIVAATCTGVYAWRSDGSVLPGWPVAFGEAFAYHVSPVIADVDGDGQIDVVAVTNGSFYPADRRARLFAFNRNGVLLPGWNGVITDIGWIPSQLSVSDLDGDSMAEVILSGQAYTRGSCGNWSSAHEIVAYRPNATQKWIQKCGARYFTVSDVDKDNSQEIVFLGESQNQLTHRIGEIAANGSLKREWPMETSPEANGGVEHLTVGDVNGDGYVEIFAAQPSQSYKKGWIYGWAYNGAPLAGWPAIFNYPVRYVTIGDINGDRSPDIIASLGAYRSDLELSVYDNQILAFNRNGVRLPSGPIYIGYSPLRSSMSEGPSQLALADIDADGNVELITQVYGDALYVLRMSTLSPATMHWPQFLQNARHTARYVVSPPVSPPPGGGINPGPKKPVMQLLDPVLY